MNVSEAKSQGLLQQNIIEAVLESILISGSLLGENGCVNIANIGKGIERSSKEEYSSSVTLPEEP